MNMFIPPLGFEFTLAEPWTFPLYHEYRNFSALEYFHLTKDGEDKWDYYDESVAHEITLPAGTTLKVDRIYIRKGARDFDSVTFFLKGPKKRIRFWAKLPFVNKIVFNELAV